jgi:hypothetical protein
MMRRTTLLTFRCRAAYERADKVVMTALLRKLQRPLRQGIILSGATRVRTNAMRSQKHYSDNPIYQRFFEDLILNPPSRPLLRSSVLSSRLTGR